ncbi:EamA family transporter RarD [Microbacterium sp. G2-8]|uniref:EamA family transporter RarD n=1 Tax=Microbacterium sp. G2-8 TaxID=2842454 RepID=UPI001C89168C|nr:EamA family transporter RarD [Microbacterium sp. G2-8]
MSGVAYGLGAYVLWGFLPLYFVLLAPTGAWETLSWRVLLSLVVCAILLTATRGWRRLLVVLRSPRLALWSAVAGVLIYINWQAFLLAALNDRVLEASLGYFINPIATVLLAVLVLGERMRPLQWTAVGIAALAVVVIIVFYGSVPWISLILAASFATYGLVKKQHLGARVDAVSGLTLESAWLTPIAAVQLVIVGTTTGITFGQHGATHALLLGLAGLVTAVPLLLFASASRRVSLTTVGLLQFAAPILQFITGAFLLGEEMPPERWIGFGLIWVACAVLMVDVAGAERTRRRGRPARNT